MTPLMIPLIVFAVVVLIVGFKDFSALLDLETDLRGKLHLLEAEHQRKMQGLNLELQHVRQLSQG